VEDPVPLPTDLATVDLAPARILPPQRSSWRSRALIVAALAAGAGVALLAWSPRVVRVTAVQRGTAVDAIYASGTIEAINRVEIRSRIAGIIDTLPVKEGERVTHGQLVAHLEAPTLQIELDRGRAELDAARQRSQPSATALRAQEQMIAAQLATAREERQRAERLSHAGGVPAKDLESARLQVATLEQQLEMVRAQQRETEVLRRADVVRSSSELAGAQARSRDADVRSPIEGEVLRVLVDLGRLVQPNEPLVRIGDARHLHVEAVLDEEDVARVRLDMPCALRVSAFGARVLRGHVSDIAPEADREHHSFRIFVTLDDPPAGLRPGMSTEVNVVAARHDKALLIPREAVRDGFVWRLGPGDRLQRVRVETGIGDLDHVEVLTGLAEGDRVLIAPDDELREHMRARARQ
jgi:multidrug efflux pump subunit AcrA (membrane-fusion protein)